MKINSSPTPRKLHMCPCSTLSTGKGINKRLEIKLCWVPNPKQCVTTVTMETKRTWFLSISHVPKTQEPPCVFLTRLGRCQTLGIRRMGSSCMKGRIKSMDVLLIAESNAVKFTSLQYDFIRSA